MVRRLYYALNETVLQACADAITLEAEVKLSRLPRFLLLCIVMSLALPALAQPSGILVNGVELSMQEVVDYRIMVPVGRYWYDPVSGLWGQEGGPYLGQIDPHLELGGALRADASGGGTDVFINGRELHALEVQYLVWLLGEQVPLGRYWMGADGVGGVEGGPASFSLAREQDPGAGSGSGSSPVFEDQMADFCARNGGCPW